MIFKRDGVIFRFNICYLSYDEFKSLNLKDKILIIQEYEWRFNTAWSFKLVRHGEKERNLFNIPAGIYGNMTSRDNLIEIFEKRYKVRIEVKE